MLELCFRAVLVFRSADRARVFCGLHVHALRSEQPAAPEQPVQPHILQGLPRGRVESHRLHPARHILLRMRPRLRQLFRLQAESRLLQRMRAGQQRVRPRRAERALVRPLPTDRILCHPFKRRRSHHMRIGGRAHGAVDPARRDREPRFRRWSWRGSWVS